MSKLKHSSSRQDHKDNGNSAVKNNVTTEEFYRQVSEGAYYIAEQRGFTTGHELDDWLHAESEVKNRLQETFK